MPPSCTVHDSQKMPLSCHCGDHQASSSEYGIRIIGILGQSIGLPMMILILPITTIAAAKLIIHLPCAFITVLTLAPAVAGMDMMGVMEGMTHLMMVMGMIIHLFILGMIVCIHLYRIPASTKCLRRYSYAIIPSPHCSINGTIPEYIGLGWTPMAFMMASTHNSASRLLFT